MLLIAFGPSSAKNNFLLLTLFRTMDVHRRLHWQAAAGFLKNREGRRWVAWTSTQPPSPSLPPPSFPRGEPNEGHCLLHSMCGDNGNGIVAAVFVYNRVRHDHQEFAELLWTIVLLAAWLLCCSETETTAADSDDYTSSSVIVSAFPRLSGLISWGKIMMMFCCIAVIVQYVDRIWLDDAWLLMKSS